MFSRLKKIWPRFLILGAIIGPGIITANADNDAGGITTLSVVGAHFGTKMLWVVLILVFALAVTQEMGMRIGLVTRQGLAGIIREQFPLGWTVFAMLAMFVANLGTVTAEFAGLAAAFSIFNISKFLVVPLSALLVWFVLFKGSFKTTQKIFLIFSAFYVVYIVNALVINPDFGFALQELFTPHLEFSHPFLITLIALIGTTVTPWGQFFIQSYVVDKGLDAAAYKTSRIEVYLGAAITMAVSFFIILTTATVLYSQGIRIESAADAALALRPLAGNLAQFLFGFGLFSASLLGAFILPVATAYAICEAFGWESGFDLKWQNGKTFYSIILFSLALPAAIVLLPGINLIKVMILTQDVNGILLPVILIFVMKIINNRKLMGEYSNKLLGNFVGLLTIGGIVAASLALLAHSLVSSG